MTKPAQVIEHWIETIQEEGHGLTQWEEDFVDSIADQFEEHGPSAISRKRYLKGSIRKRHDQETRPYVPSLYSEEKEHEQISEPVP